MHVARTKPPTIIRTNNQVNILPDMEPPLHNVTSHKTHGRLGKVSLIGEVTENDKYPDEIGIAISLMDTVSGHEITIYDGVTRLSWDEAISWTQKKVQQLEQVFSGQS